MPNIASWHPQVVHVAVALLLVGDAFLAAGRPASARATLDQLARDFPDNPRIKDRLAQIK